MPLATTTIALLMFPLAATAAYDSPLFWAVFVGWIMSVVLHEFAHGFVAWLGGDYTIRERGGLSLNPLQYVDPVMSLLLPAVFLLMGGIPLPGGVTYVRVDLLRNRAWQSAVSLAGPAMNALLFLLCALPLHPAVGWVDPYVTVLDWTPAQRVLATSAILHLWAVLLNLVPVPPLDGFGAIAPFLPDEMRLKLTTPPLSTVLFLGFFFVVLRVPQVRDVMYRSIFVTLGALGFDDLTVDHIRRAYNFTLFRDVTT